MYEISTLPLLTHEDTAFYQEKSGRHPTTYLPGFLTVLRTVRKKFIFFMTFSLLHFCLNNANGVRCAPSPSQRSVIH